MEGPLDRPIHLSSRTMGVRREKKKRKQKSRQLITSFAGLYRLPFYGSATKTLDAHWNQIKLAVGFEAGSGKWEIQTLLLSLTLGPTTEYNSTVPKDQKTLQCRL